jgi:hypothetical protein
VVIEIVILNTSEQLYTQKLKMSYKEKSRMRAEEIDNHPKIALDFGLDFRHTKGEHSRAT